MNAENEKQFPAGLRVLVVDDDLTCLKLLDNLLKKCQYKVTTTNKAKVALQMLRENKNMFDIVISDVEMPDMDGIKLLHFVGLEMDIPVIMLSAYSDHKRVMQGVKNGAVDYLVKPVRIQELQNIWQHVLRKKTVTPRRPPCTANTDNSPLSEKRKDKWRADHSSDGNDFQDEEEQIDSEAENEGSTNPKKTRLFWSIELHQKFVDVVNQLGIEKAFPKKILDIMNIDGLTREKVASHLQKYRLYLKKMSSGENSGSNKMIEFEEAQIGGLGGGYGVYQSLSGSTTTARYPTQVANPYSRGILRRFNTSVGLNLQTLSSSPMLQQQISNSNHFTTLGNSGGSVPVTQNSATFFENYSQQNTGPFSLQPRTQNTLALNQGPLQSISEFGDKHQSSFTIPSVTQSPTFNQNKPNDPFYFLNDLTSFDHLSGTHDGLNVNGVNSLGQAQGWPGNPKPNYFLNPNSVEGSGLAPALPAAASSTPDQSFSQSGNLTTSPFSQLEGGSSQFQQLERAAEPPGLKMEDFLVDDDPKQQAGPSQNGEEYLEDIVGKFMKQEDDGSK